MKKIDLLTTEDLDDRFEGLKKELRAWGAMLSEGGAAPGMPGWLPLKKLAAYFGMSPKQAGRYLASAQSDGAITAFRPTDCNGTSGHMLYSVADFEAYLKRGGLAMERGVS